MGCLCVGMGETECKRDGEERRETKGDGTEDGHFISRSLSRPDAVGRYDIGE